MDSRRMLEQHVQTLTALLRGGVTKGMGQQISAQEDDVQSALRAGWEVERNILRRVLSERGDPFELLIEWRERTQGFLDKYPEREGWTDKEGVSWNAQEALDAIDKLLEQIEAWEMEAEEFDDEDEEEW